MTSIADLAVRIKEDNGAIIKNQDEANKSLDSIDKKPPSIIQFIFVDWDLKYFFTFMNIFFDQSSFDMPGPINKFL